MTHRAQPGVPALPVTLPLTWSELTVLILAVNVFDCILNVILSILTGMFLFLFQSHIISSVQI